MSSYDFTFKILLLGDASVDKTSFTKRYCYNVFNQSERLTIGVDFHVKTINLHEKKIKLQIWDVGGEERFRFLLPTYCLGANAAFLLYDVTRPQTLDNISEWTNIVHQKSGDIPIMLVGAKIDLEETQCEVPREHGIEVARKNHLSAFAEISYQNGKAIKDIFQSLTEIIIRRYTNHYNVSQNLLILSDKNELILPDKNEFIINNYLKLLLEENQTNIYVGGRLFRQCKYLMLNLPIANIRDFDSIESIDEAAEKLDSSMEGRGRYKYKISPETEFWAHCSNLQMWYEHNYDTNLLHRNLAFPLLKALTTEGDPLAKKVFKEEIARRFESGYPPVVLYLINQRYLEFLNKEELDTVIESPKFLNSLSKWLFNSEIPNRLFNKLKDKIGDLDCPYCGIKLKDSLTQKVVMGKSIKCKYCYTSITRIK